MKRLLLGAIIVGTVLAPSSARASASSTAQDERTGDARWQAWIGCWVPIGPDAVSWNPTTQQVCVTPAVGASAVDILTVRNGRIAAREHIDANGEHRKSERDTCTGWESAQWSPDARRVYLHSEYDCAGVKRRSSGLMAMSLKGDWLNIVDVGVRENTGVRVIRHRPVGITATIPAEITAALDGRTQPAEAARAAARAPIGEADIVEASRQVDAAVVEAWVNEFGQPFRVDAGRLVRLAGQGVPDRVIDMLVALSYPKAFSIKPSATALGSLSGDGREGWRGGGGLPIGFLGAGDLLDCGLYGNGFSLYGWDPCSPYGYALYNPRYRYAPYGALMGGYGGGWYWAGEPTISRSRPNDGAHGQVVNGRGYSEGSGSSGSSSSGGGGSSGSSSGGGGGGAASSGGRTAQPR